LKHQVLEIPWAVIFQQFAGSDTSRLIELDATTNKAIAFSF